MNQTEYLDEFPVNEEGLLLVSDLALIEALRRRAERRENAQDAPRVGEPQAGIESS